MTDEVRIVWVKAPGLWDNRLHELMKKKERRRRRRRRRRRTYKLWGTRSFKKPLWKVDICFGFLSPIKGIIVKIDSYVLVVDSSQFNFQRLKKIHSKKVQNNPIQSKSSLNNIDISYGRSSYTNESVVEPWLSTQIFNWPHVQFFFEIKALTSKLVLTCNGDCPNKNVCLRSTRKPTTSVPFSKRGS